MKRFVWLDIHTGEFSNSWDEKTQEQYGAKGDELTEAGKRGWILIEYTCHNSPSFEFYKAMLLTTNLRKIKQS